MITVKVPGKIHLMGEHSVVYGKPALLTAVDKYCTVQLIPTSDANITITAKNLDKTVSLSQEMVVEKTDKARKLWQEFNQKVTVQKSSIVTDTSLGEPLAASSFSEKSPPRGLASSKRRSPSYALAILETDMDYPVIAIGETLRYYNNKIISGFLLIIDSEIPVGSGLGSSASLAVAIVAAVSKYLGETDDKKTINEIAFLVEQRLHGLPSGGDNGVVCYGGLVWFEKKIGIKPLDFTISQKLAQSFILIDTGRPMESTGEMVSFVKDLSQKEPELLVSFLSDQEKLTKRLVTAIKSDDEKEIISIIRTGEKNLESIGVVSRTTQEIIREIEEIDGAAKISGAGGRKNNSGIVLAFHTNRNKLENLLQSLSLKYFHVQLGVEGLRFI
jgi:mevalonate kinase